MRSLIGALRNSAPVAYVATRGLRTATSAPVGMEAQMRSMGGVGTLFAVVDTTAPATASVKWKLWRKSASGKPEDRIEVTSHAALTVWNKPNKFFTQQELVESGQQHHDLTGETWLVVARNPKFPSIPLELWPVRPDRMEPVPDPDDFLVGYFYHAPGGDRIPLKLEDVLFNRRPNPLTPYRGIGAVQTILADLDSTRYSAEWMRNFFLNSAEPGGIIEYDRRLSDDEFTEVTERWREQHQGVAQAHRVAVIEQGKFIERKYSMRDMQFTQLREASREVILEAFRMPKFAIGIVEDVNRATAEASKAWFAESQTVPRLERWKSLLNNDFLPLFGPTSAGLEFDYENPVPLDSESENKERESKASAAKTYTDAGFTGDSVKEALDLPEALVWEKPKPPPAPIAPPAVPDPGAPAEESETPLFEQLAARLFPQPRNAVENPEDVDLTPVQEAWEAALAKLVTEWATIEDAQRAQLVDQVIEIIDSGNLEDLASMDISSADGAKLLASAMEALAEGAAEQVVMEAVAQGEFDVNPVTPAAKALAATAAVTASLLAAELALSAAREAMRVNGPGRSGREVADQVATHLRSLTDAFPRQQLGGALTGSQNAARIETLRAGPVAALYANETLDKNTCKPCKAIHGRWLGNSDNGTDMEQVERTYPTSGYVNCEGGARCRGTVTGVWRSKQTGDGQ